MIMIEGKAVTDPDQFDQMVEAALRRRPDRLTRFFDLDQAVERLADFRQGWEEAAEGRPLIELTASVGLMLADFAQILGLGDEDTARVLGPDLASNLADYQDARINVKEA